jgi:hypothetical protein
MDTTKECVRLLSLTLGLVDQAADEVDVVGRGRGPVLRGLEVQPPARSQGRGMSEWGTRERPCRLGAAFRSHENVYAQPRHDQELIPVDNRSQQCINIFQSRDSQHADFESQARLGGRGHGGIAPQRPPLRHRRLLRPHGCKRQTLHPRTAMRVKTLCNIDKKSWDYYVMSVRIRQTSISSADPSI